MTTAKVPWMGQLIEVNLLPIRPATASKPALFMYEEAAYKFVQMDQAAKAAGITLEVNTAFRDHEYQTRLYNEYLQKMALYNAGKGPKPSVVAKPGTSDHERGLSVDINTGVPEEKRTASKIEKAASSRIYSWLHNNADKYGFENDVSTEPWHWTYEVEALKIAKAAGGGLLAVGAVAALVFFMLKRG